VIDVRRFGCRTSSLFYCALAGTTPDNQRWVARKINTVAALPQKLVPRGRLLEQSGPELQRALQPARGGLPAHGGLLPLTLRARESWARSPSAACPSARTTTWWWKRSCLVTGRDYQTMRLPMRRRWAMAHLRRGPLLTF